MTRVPLNDLARTDPTLVDDVKQAVADIIEQGAFLKSSRTAMLEARLTDRFDGRPVLAVANGTDALYLALRSVDVGAGSCVATVANAGGYTTSAVLRGGASTVYIDVDQHDAQMCPASLATALGRGDRIDAVVVTHLYGLAGEIEAIQALCDAHGVPLVEDCAQAIGARVGGRPVGTFGAAAALSFYPTKNLGAFGDAGAVVSANAAAHQYVSSLAQYGWARRFEVDTPGGLNSRIDEIQAAVLLAAEPQLDTQNERRRAIVSRYADAVGGGRRFVFEPSERCVAHLAVMVTDHRADDAARLDRAGVATGIHYPVPDHRQRGWCTLVPQTPLPTTEWLTERILTVPCFPGMTDAEIDQVASALSTL